MPVYKQYDPTPAFTFGVSIGGVEVGFFTEIGGLGVGRDIVDFKEGGTNDHLHVFYGRETEGKLTLKRGTDPELKLLDWFNQGAINGKVKRVNLTIIIYDKAGTPIQSWDLSDAWPIKYNGPTFNVDEVQPAAEEIEIAYTGIEGSVWEEEE